MPFRSSEKLNCYIMEFEYLNLTDLSQVQYRNSSHFIKQKIYSYLGG